MKTLRKYFIPAFMLIAGLVIGWNISSSTGEEAAHQHTDQPGVWTCSMHPSVRQSEPGQCPICGMNLVPVETGEDEGDPREIRMSETAMRLANIQTTVVKSGNSSKTIRLNGKVQVDERKKFSQPSHIPGRIEQLLVNFTGEFIRRGQVIAQVYSPALVSAQQELFETLKIKTVQPALYAAAREKLKNWKLTDQQIDALILGGNIQEKFPITADASGIVLERKVSVGDYVMQGGVLFEAADLSRVWVSFDVYESDMPWVKLNSAVAFTIQSMPGETWHGKISFIDPVINATTRVALARVEMENPGLRLKPEMFVSAEINTHLSTGAAISIPKTAILWTGERSVVYVKTMAGEAAGFMMHEVTLGPSLGDAYVVLSGLNEGMEIVTNGTFTVDAAAQLAGKPSMMSPTGGPAATGHHHGANPTQTEPATGGTPEVNNKFNDQLLALLDPYLVLKDAFVQSHPQEAAMAARQLKVALNEVDMRLLKGEAHNAWMPLLEKLRSSINTISESVDVDIQRRSFSELSDSYYEAIKQFNVSGLEAYYQFCPMAFNNQGGHWISKDKAISNPYFGAAMLRCGETISTIK